MKVINDSASNRGLKKYRTITVDGGRIPAAMRLIGYRVTHRRENINGQWVSYRVKNMVARIECLAAKSLVDLDFNELLQTTSFGTLKTNVVDENGTLQYIYYTGPWTVDDVDTQVDGPKMLVTISMVSDESDQYRYPTTDDTA